MNWVGALVFRSLQPSTLVASFAFIVGASSYQKPQNALVFPSPPQPFNTCEPVFDTFLSLSKYSREL